MREGGRSYRRAYRPSFDRQEMFVLLATLGEASSRTRNRSLIHTLSRIRTKITAEMNEDNEYATDLQLGTVRQLDERQAR